MPTTEQLAEIEKIYARERAEREEKFGTPKRKKWRIWISQKRLVELVSETGASGYTLYCDLRLYARNKRYCYPSIPTLVRDLKTGRREIIKNLKKLELTGNLKIIKTKGRVNIYWLLK